MSIQFTEQQWAEMRRQALEVVPKAFADGRLPALLMGYQARGIELLDQASTRVLVVEKSRRIGYTWGLAAYAVLRAARQRSARGMDVMYISYSQEMTREFVDAAGMWARAFALGAAEENEFLFDDVNPSDPSDTKQIKAFRIQFASGFEIIALSSAPRSLRGKQGVVIIDEAAFVESLKELLKAALAFLMWGGQVVVVSTHNGTDNPFNELVQDVLARRKPYAHVHVDFDEALKDGLYQRICLVTGTEWTPEGEAAWRAEIAAFYGDGADEELFCIPAQGSGAWLTGPLIESRMVPGVPILRWELPAAFLQLPELIQRGTLSVLMTELEPVLAKLDRSRRHALGFDFGRVGDLSVLWLLSITPTMRRETVAVIEMRRFPHKEQIAVTEAVIRAMPMRCGAAFDATGEGNVVAEAMQRKFGVADHANARGGLVAAIKLSTEWYRTEMPPVRVAFEDASIFVPKDDAIFGDLRLVRVIRGVPQLPDVRTGSGDQKRHGDAAIALALAYYASCMSAVVDVEIQQADRENGVTDALEGYDFEGVDARLDDYVRM